MMAFYNISFHCVASPLLFSFVGRFGGNTFFPDRSNPTLNLKFTCNLAVGGRFVAAPSQQAECTLSLRGPRCGPGLELCWHESTSVCFHKCLFFLFITPLGCGKTAFINFSKLSCKCSDILSGKLYLREGNYTCSGVQK